jgi:MerR family transcriptional regulator, copper efflux regulator
MSTRYHGSVKIGELASRTGVSSKTIRHYEDIGVMPTPARNASGYREYAADAAARLGFVRAAQSVGLTLGEIREGLAFRDRGETPCGHVTQLIQEHATDLARRIAALEAMRRDLEGLAADARTAGRHGRRGRLLPHHRGIGHARSRGLGLDSLLDQAQGRAGSPAGRVGRIGMM